MNAAELVKSGDLASARAALAEGVKKAPTDAALRYEYAEVLLLLGDLERADNQFDLVATHDASWSPAIAVVRQLIRAEKARQEVFQQGRAPELIAETTTEIETALRILLESREDPARAAELRAEADEAASPLAGRLNETEFQGLRDLDDLTADVVEILTSTGKYFWAPWHAIRSFAPQPPKRLRDLVWRPTELDVANGPSGVVYIPSVYFDATGTLSDDQRLGRRTDFVDENGVTRGVGQRCLLVGDDIVPLSDITTLEID